MSPSRLSSWDLARRPAAIAQRAFDLVLLDIRLGSDSNAGVGLIHDLSKRQNCPVIVVSGMRPISIAASCISSKPGII